jgi:hypothetical protein
MILLAYFKAVFTFSAMILLAYFKYAPMPNYAKTNDFAEKQSTDF